MLRSLVDRLGPATHAAEAAAVPPVPSASSPVVASANSTATTKTTAAPLPSPVKESSVIQNEPPAQDALAALLPMAHHQPDFDHPKTFTAFDVFKECLKYSGCPSTWRRAEVSRQDVGRVLRCYEIFTLLMTPHEKNILLAEGADDSKDAIQSHLMRNFIRVWAILFRDRGLKLPPSINHHESKYKWSLSLNFTMLQNLAVALEKGASVKNTAVNLSTPYTENVMIMEAVKKVQDRFPSPVVTHAPVPAPETGTSPPTRKRKTGDGVALSV